MSSQPPVNSQPPQRGKDTWRLRGVHRAEPHLGEEDRDSRIFWVIGVAIVLIVAIVVVILILSSQTPSPAPTTTRTPTVAPSSTRLPAATGVSSTSTPVPIVSPSPPIPVTTTAAPRPTAPFVRYRVRAGDTLSEIAQKYNVTVRSIQQANSLRNETIIEGEELIIPIATPRAP